MDCCSSCSDADDIMVASDQAADRLAGLLAQAPEYRELVRLADLIHLDPDVQRVTTEMRARMMGLGEVGSQGIDSIDDLRDELEALPAVQAFRRAEAAVRALFKAVEQAISAGAGLAFAPNAQRSGCG